MQVKHVVYWGDLESAKAAPALEVRRLCHGRLGAEQLQLSRGGCVLRKLLLALRGRGPPGEE